MKKFLISAIAIASAMFTLTGCGLLGDYDEYDDYDDYGYEDDYGYDDEYEDDNYDYDEDPNAGGFYDGSDGELTNFDYSQWDQYKFGGKLGSAKHLDGKTVLVAIFADDANTTWDGDDENKYATLDYLGVATEWLSKSVSKYGKSASFVYDWEANSDLYFETSFDHDMTEDGDDTYYAEMDYVEENIPSEDIMNKYNADNIIYMIYFNNDASNQVTSATYAYISEEFEDYPYEIVNIYTRCDGEDENPASYAHEILHTFGAPDFYMADEDGQNYGITEEFVQYNEENYSNAIMYTTFDAESQVPYYDHVSNDFSDLVAYYVGLIDYSEEKDYWGLGDSQY